MASSQDPPPTTRTEELLWKIVRAATALHSAADHWQRCQRRSASLRRHIHRCSTVAAVLHKTSTCATTFGSAAKVVGGVAVAVGVVSRVPSLTGMGSRIWRAGCATKLAGLGGKVLAEIWDRGFKDTLTAYMSSVCGFLQSMSLFRTVLEEIEVLMPAEFVANRFMPLLLLVCPEELFTYACHVVKLFVSPQHYSALYDFATMALSSFTGTASLPLNFLHEVESYHVLAVLNALPKPLQVASAVVHAGKEVMDLAASLRSLSGRDFHLVHKVVVKLRNASSLFTNSIREAPLLTSLMLEQNS
ncbi:uncharacterized protein LOC143288526 [Babylonia areolata]|uniref:uncharacterized protein LOC143288526 n=1 Tax=Babylonia areolata TaxID=304850 RepID=UPI003FD0A45B